MARDLYALRDESVFDSREVIDRIEELEADDSRDENDEEELAALRAFAEEAEGYAPDWHYGATFIRDSYFVEYAQELADDIGAVDSDAGWPSAHIDWPAAAEALQMDYSEVELDGISFWTHA